MFKKTAVLIALATMVVCSVAVRAPAHGQRRREMTPQEKRRHTPAASDSFDPYVDRMLKLKHLYEAGFIDESEYAEMKEEIIFKATGVHMHGHEEEHVDGDENDDKVSKYWDTYIISSSSLSSDSTGSSSTTTVANITYSLTTTFLLNVFSEGLPRSYSDVLPTGQNYWTTPMYLVVGAIDPYGNKLPLDSQIASQERTLTRYGLNLYDGATWCIALYLEGLGDVVDMYMRNILYTSTTGPMAVVPGGLNNIRANKPGFTYGPTQVAGDVLPNVTLPGNVTFVPFVPFEAPVAPVEKTVPGSYFYRMIGPKYSMIDPFEGSYGNAWKTPWPNNDTSTPWNTAGEIHWNDWKPITGENVWGCILGPVQMLWIANGTEIREFTTFHDAPPQIQMALSIMPAVNAMVTPLGGLYHCPKGTLMFPADPSEETNVSNENNFSGYAALNALYQVLANKTTGTSDPVLVKAMTDLDAIMEGFNSWFTTQLLPANSTGETQVVYQGGHVTFEGEFLPINISAFGGLAVDCQTWGMTVLGQALVDANYGGVGTAYQIWQTTKKNAGYYTSKGVLGGVGYTQTAHNLIWSAEWTWGAINMANKLSYEYSLIGETDMANSLAADAQSMYDTLTQPIIRCENGAWCGGGLYQEDGSYMYANERFFIPWGWYANPIAATCSTAWSIMNKHGFNAFLVGGGYVSVFPEPSAEQKAAAREAHFEIFGEYPKTFSQRWGAEAVAARIKAAQE